MKRLGKFLEEMGERVSKLGYVLRDPAYAAVRRSGGARDLYQLLKKPWLRAGEIGTVLDVGSNEGQFFRTARALFPDAAIFAFEPNPKLERPLRELLSPGRGDVFFGIACGEERATLPLHIPELAAASSLLQASQVQLSDFPDLRAKQAIDVPVERLDDVLALEPPPRKPYLLKLDVQGYEMEVLRGAERTLEETAVIVCEVNLAPFYRGQATLDALYGFLRERGFKLVDIGEPIRAAVTGEMLYFDVAFLR